MCGFTSLSERLDVEELRDLMNGWFDRLSTLIPSFGGTIDKFIGDAVMALFGALVVHDNDPKRAIDAALAMQSELEEYNREVGERIGQPMKIRIGINTGRVYAGMLGGDSHKSYTVMGDAVNVASRLESSCPVGSILVSESTLEHVRGIYDFRQQEPLRVKGKAEPLVTFEILGRRRPSARSESNEDALVVLSRSEELLQAETLFASAVSLGKPMLLAVTADEGMAKNQFSSCLAHRLREHALGASLSTHCDAGGGAPFQILIDLLSQASEDTDDLASYLQGCELADESIRVLTHLMRLPQGPLGAPASLGDPGALHHATLEAARQWLQALARQGPLVLRIHNLHNSPDASLDLLRYLVDSEALPLLVVVTATVNIREQGGFWSPLLAGATSITLGTLETSMARKVAAHILSPMDPPSPELIERIAEASGGNPGFIEESVRALLARGILIETDKWVLRDNAIPSTLPIPDTVGRMIQVCVDGLSAEGKSMLQRAAVIGPRFDAEALLALEEGEPRSIRSIEEALSEAVKAGLLSVSQRGGGRPSEYRFRPAMVRDEVYETVVAKQRRVWHQCYADSLRLHAAVALSSPKAVTLEDLAAHVMRSGNFLEAAALYRKAGDAAASVYANSDAKRQYEAASVALGNGGASAGERADVLQLLGRMLALGGDHGAAQDAFALAIELLGGNEAAKRASLEVERGRSLAASGKRDSARQSYMQAVLLASGHDDSDSRIALADAQQNLGWVDYLDGDLDSAESLFLAGLATSKDIDAIAVQARCFDSLGTLARVRGQTSLAIEHKEKALELRRTSEDRATIATSFLNLGAVQAGSGDYASAASNFAEALKLHRQRGNTDGVAMALLNLGGAEFYLGSGEAAQRLLAEATFMAVRGSAWYTPECYRYSAEAALQAGDAAKARTLADEGFAFLGDNGPIEMRGNLCGAMGHIALHEGNLDEAASYLEKALGAHESAQNTFELAITLMRLSSLSVALHKQEVAKEQLQRARQLFAEASNATWVTRTDLALAELG